jgi:hypothetical protein
MIRSSSDAPPLARLPPHQPRPARDAADALERGGVARRPCRVQVGARAAERDAARGVVQLTLTVTSFLARAEAPARLEQ